MGLKEKLAEAKKATWITDGLSENEIKSTVELAKISAKIESKRSDLHMTQEEFARYMGVSQGMVSKWESREYNFTIKTLNEICEKLDLVLDITIQSREIKNCYAFIEWTKDSSHQKKKQSCPLWLKQIGNLEEAIA